RNNIGGSMAVDVVAFEVITYVFTFFFSSRRRHTRFSRDWSSDVCSSDLPVHRCQEAGVVFHQFNPFRHLTVSNLDVFRQVFQGARTMVIAQQYALWFKDLDQRFNNLVFHLLHAGTGNLHDQEGTETIHHQTRQQISIAEDQAVVGLIKGQFPQSQRLLDAVNQQGFVERIFFTAADQPSADERIRVHQGNAERLAIVP